MHLRSSLTRVEALIIDSLWNLLKWFVWTVIFPLSVFCVHICVCVHICFYPVCYCVLTCVPFFIWMAEKSLLKLFSFKLLSLGGKTAAAVAAPVCMLLFFPLLVEFALDFLPCLHPSSPISPFHFLSLSACHLFSLIYDVRKQTNQAMQQT